MGSNKGVELPRNAVRFLRAFSSLWFLQRLRATSSGRVRYSKDASDVGSTGSHGERGGSGRRSRCKSAQCGCSHSGAAGYIHHSRLRSTTTMSMSTLALLRPATRAAFRRTARSSLFCARSFHVSRTIRFPQNDGGLNNILAGGDAPPVQVKTITAQGIQLADGLILPSACIFLNDKVFLWNVPEKTWDDWKPEHFEIFETVVPKPGK